MRSEPVAAHVFPEFILPAVVSGHRDAWFEGDWSVLCAADSANCARAGAVTKRG